jgi:hypothetical protein
MTALDPAALAVRFARALENAGVPYAIGGAIGSRSTSPPPSERSR